MDLLTPQIIWKGYDASVLPLDTTMLSDSEINGCRVLSAYFNGPTSVDGVARVYAKAVIPIGVENPPVVVILPDVDKSCDEFDYKQLTDNGYAVVLPDYAGKRQDTPHFTLYPKSMENADFTPECLTALPADIRSCCWIIWAQIAMRAITFAQSLNVDKTKIGLIGIGVASSAVLKTTTVDSRLSCAIMMFSSGYCPDSKVGENYLQYKAGLMDEVYAPFVKVPLLVMGASNEQDDSIDSLSDTFSLIKNEDCRISISERASHSQGAKQKNNIVLWLARYLKGEGTIPSQPILTVSCSEHILYYNVEVAEGMDDVSLFTSQAIRMGALRNWHEEKLNNVGENTYIARVDVNNSKEPIYAFVNGRIQNGISISSPVSVKIPALMGVNDVPVKSKRLIYDNDMGVDDWMVLSPYAEINTLSMEKGPFGISGVSSALGTLSTFKPGDIQFRGNDGYYLQIIMHSNTPQTVKITVTACDTKNSELNAKYSEYSAYITITPEDNWLKSTLSASEFKSPQSVCPGWSNVVNLRIDSDAPIAISSVVWV